MEHFRAIDAATQANHRRNQTWSRALRGPDTVVRLTKEFRADYIPAAKTWEAFELLLILHRMVEVHQQGHESSTLGVSRVIGMPRTTVQRRLAQLKQMRAVEQHGPRFTVVHAFMNAEHMIEGFKRR